MDAINTVELKKVLVEQNIDTIKKFAEVCDIDRNIAAKVYRGKAKPGSETMFKIVAGLKLSPTRAGKIFFTT